MEEHRTFHLGLEFEFNARIIKIVFRAGDIAQ
jgi:hypothetical protein